MHTVTTEHSIIAVQADFEKAAPGYTLVTGEVWSELSKLGMSALLRDYVDTFAGGNRWLVQSYRSESGLLWLETQDVINWLRDCYLAVPASLQAFKDHETSVFEQGLKRAKEIERERERERVLKCQQIYWVSRQIPFVLYNPQYEHLDYEVHMPRPGAGVDTLVCECDTREDAVFVAKALFAASIISRDGVEYDFEPEYVEY